MILRRTLESTKKFCDRLFLGDAPIRVKKAVSSDKIIAAKRDGGLRVRPVECGPHHIHNVYAISSGSLVSPSQWLAESTDLSAAQKVDQKGSERDPPCQRDRKYGRSFSSLFD